MNKLISTKERIFISLVGPSGSVKFHLIFDFKLQSVCKNCHCWRTHGSEHSIYQLQFVSSSKLGRDVELGITHKVLFKSPRDVLQVSTLSQQLGLGYQLQ